MPQKITKALSFAVLLWLVGFVWGSLVFVTPVLKRIPPIPYISSNPAISFPILVVWIILAPLLYRKYLKSGGNRTVEGLKLGLIFSVTNLALDLVILVILLRAGVVYFGSVTVWLGYLLLFLIPWVMGRSSRSAST